MNRIVLALMTAAAAIQLVGCSTTRSDQDRVVVADIHALERFVEGAVFYLRNDNGVEPVAPMAPDELVDYVVSHYDRDAGVRRLVVRYFLLYDRALIRRGLIDDGASDGSLVRVLWDKESSRDPVFKESPSTTAMLRHIGRQAEYLGLTARDRSMLAENERLHEAYIRRATEMRSGEGPESAAETASEARMASVPKCSEQSHVPVTVRREQSGRKRVHPMKAHSTILCLTCMAALTAHTTAQQGRLAPGLQFARVDSVIRCESGSEVLVAGSALPHGFSIRSDRIEGHREYARAMDFQLVVPRANVKVGSAELDEKRPFYCSKEVITVEQASSFLRRFGSDAESMSQFAAYSKGNFVSGDADQQVHRAADELVNLPTAPAIGLSLSDCMEICENMGSMIGMVVRLPSLAEWCVAMRCGEASRYWWGDDWATGPAVALMSGPVPLPPADRLIAIADRRRLIRNRDGFGYLFGTICEVVWPSERERDVLRDVFGKELASESVSYHPDSAVGCYGGFLIGSSVFPIQSQLPESLFDPSFVRLSQFTGMPRELAGIRLVIEIPVGPVEVRERVDSDGSKLTE